MTNNKGKLNKFLDIMPGQKEAGLIIAEDETEFSSLAEAINKGGFVRSENIADLL